MIRERPSVSYYELSEFPAALPPVSWIETSLERISAMSDGGNTKETVITDDPTEERAVVDIDEALRQLLESSHPAGTVLAASQDHSSGHRHVFLTQPSSLTTLGDGRNSHNASHLSYNQLLSFSDNHPRQSVSNLTPSHNSSPPASCAGVNVSHQIVRPNHCFQNERRLQPNSSQTFSPLPVTSLAASSWAGHSTAIPSRSSENFMEDFSDSSEDIVRSALESLLSLGYGLPFDSNTDNRGGAKVSRTVHQDLQFPSNETQSTAGSSGLAFPDIGSPGQSNIRSTEHNLPAHGHSPLTETGFAPNQTVATENSLASAHLIDGSVRNHQCPTNEQEAHDPTNRELLSNVFLEHTAENGEGLQNSDHGNTRRNRLLDIMTNSSDWCVASVSYSDGNPEQVNSGPISLGENSPHADMESRNVVRVSDVVDSVLDSLLH